MSQAITITTGARLHFGPLSYRPATGRHFGGVGAMIEAPGFRVRLQTADDDQITPCGATADRITQFARRYRESCPADHQPPACAITIEQDLPSHNGLGSGTQIGLAIARGLSLLTGESDVDAAELALRVGRGRRSAVGIYGFAEGGLIVDAGHTGDEAIGALACQLPMPAEWRVLLITPRDGGVGLFGEGEEQAFETLRPMPATLTDRLCRIVVTELLPAVQSASLAAFSQAIADYGRLVGEFFAPIQGGLFGHPRTDELIARLEKRGIRGAGQTSWGPTVFAVVPDRATGEDVARDLQHAADIQIVALRNTGATIEQAAVGMT